MKEDCLHCLLVRTAVKWLKSHNASSSEICEMVGRGAGEIVALLPEHQGEEIDIYVLGIKHITKGRLH